MSMGTVTERDFRKPEFIDAKPEDYEFRADGAVVRKDRWERGIYKISNILKGGRRGDFDIENLVHAVEFLVDQLPDAPQELTCTCGKRVNVDESGPCKSCGEPVCDDCQVTYDKFSQIDYCLHKDCAESRD